MTRLATAYVKASGRMSYPATQTYWLEPSDFKAWGLRRYTRTEGSTGWDCAGGYHRALVYYERIHVPFTRERQLRGDRDLPHDDPRWPVSCEHCDYRFTDDDAWQDWGERIYFIPDPMQGLDRTDSTNFVLHPNAGAPGLGCPSAPPGASWDAWWYPDAWKGPDGIALMVRLPNGHDWSVDNEASNCTRPGDRSHKCWVRTGDPRLAQVTVGKSGGETCDAGAGSIAAGEGAQHYHGFLVSGILSVG